MRPERFLSFGALSPAAEGLAGYRFEQTQLAKTKKQMRVPERDAGGIPACSRWSSVSDTTGFVPPSKHPGRGASSSCSRRTAPKKKFRATWFAQTPPLASLPDAQIGVGLTWVSLPLHRPATGWDASGILKQTAPPTPTPPTPTPPTPTPPTICSHDTPFHGPNDEMVFRAGVGRTDTAKRSAEQGVDLACDDHTQELVWRHRNVFERECELRCRLPRRRWQTPDPSHPLKTAKRHKRTK